MSGGLEVSIIGAERLQERLRALTNEGIDELLDVVGSEVENQTRRRITHEKKGPDGSEWAPWAESYAKTRKKGKSLLVGRGHLRDSIQHSVGTSEVEVGSNLVYAAIHQFGGEEVDMPIPARPYLGLSEENEKDLGAVIDDFFEQWMNR